MRIETERLILRTPEMGDAPSILEIRNSPYVLRYNPMTEWDLPRMEKQVEEEMQSGRAVYIVGKATGALLGGVWLEDDELRYGVKAFTLSYYLGESCAGKGYMTEALAAIVGYAFRELGAQVLSARVFTPNQGSVRVLQKLGFTHEGTLRRAVAAPDGTVYDDMLFSLLPPG
mgnify:CR=1 FL=1